MMKGLRIGLVLLISVFFVACGPVNVPPVSSYAITNLNPAPTSHYAATRYTILVSSPSASPGYQTSSMIYMVKPYELKSFADNQWVAPPAQMLLPLLVQSIRKTGHFAAVVSPPFAGLTNFHVDTQLLKLQQEFFTTPSVIRMSVQASLVSNLTSRVVASRLFEVIIPTQKDNPYGGVVAANQAANQIAERIAQFTAQNAR